MIPKKRIAFEEMRVMKRILPLLALAALLVLPEGVLSLPEGLDPEGWGTDYFVYILAENRHGMYETDYASVPAAVEAPGASAD